LAHDGYRSLKDDGLAAHALQLLHRSGVVARFAKGLAVQICHLVGANDNSFWMKCRDCVGFG
jgi:hypothetical protein